MEILEHIAYAESHSTYLVRKSNSSGKITLACMGTDLSPMQYIEAHVLLNFLY